MAAPPSRRASPPALPFELVEEILLRLPPDDPACLLRASLVCQTWGDAISHPGFRRRHHELHRTPPVLGFLHNWDNETITRFISTTSSSFFLAAPDYRSWRALDCRHGRALFLSKGQGTGDLLVWEPITGAQQRVPVPAAFKSDCPIAAVVCAAFGCDHRDCHGGPFYVVFLSIEEDTDDTYVTSACVYSSETGRWGELTSACVHNEFDYFSFYSSVLVGTSLLYFMSDEGRIQEYDLDRHNLTVIDTPDCMRSNLMLAEGDGLGVIEDFDPQLKLWSREKSDGTDARWVLNRVICLENLLPNGALGNATNLLHVVGFAEGANVIFVTTGVGLFTIELQSHQVRKVCDDHGFCNLIPVVSFYTPHSRLEAFGGEHHYLPLLPSPTEEVGGEEGGREEEKILEQTQELFDKCKAMEEGNFANASDCFNHTLETRIPHHGELPPDCGYGHALLCKTPEVTDPSGNVSENAPNEESVKNTATTSKVDPGSSDASGDEHGDSEEGATRMLNIVAENRKVHLLLSRIVPQLRFDDAKLQNGNQSLWTWKFLFVSAT